MKNPSIAERYSICETEAPPLLPSLRLTKKGKQSIYRLSHLLTSLPTSLVSPVVYNSSCSPKPPPPSLPPSLRPANAPIGSRSCSAVRLLAPSYPTLARPARICPRTSRSHASCLWTDGTESEANGQGEGKGKQ